MGSCHEAAVRICARPAALLAGIALAGALAAGAAGAEAMRGPVVEGIATMAWGDPVPGGQDRGALRLTVRDDQGVDHAFVLPAGSPVVNFDAGASQGLRVRVYTDPSRGERGEPLAVAFLGPRTSDSPEVTGSQPWISLLCKFSNLAAEPRSQSYFVQMFDNSPGRLDHYWRESSYDQIDVVGSGASQWLVLPRTQSAYVPTPGSGCSGGSPADLDLLFDDCTAVADPFVDFSNGGTGGFAGINLMFNGDLDGCAWGGGHFATLDGVSKSWRTTWEPPWGYANVSVMAHEMGHGFGLPHSNNWDGDGSPYDNSWDVMSDAWNHAATDPTYGGLGKHTIAYHKDRLAWFPSGTVLVASAPGTYEGILSDVALRPPIAGYRMAKIPIPASTRFWTVETRRRTGLYDAELPGDAVVIHEINPARPEPAWCYDSAVPPDDQCDAATVLWGVEETFVDPASQTSVRVVEQTADGFRVVIYAGVPGPLFADGFETGGIGRWSDSTP